MTLNTTSYFAGIGTVVAALTVGFGGALLIIGSNDKIASENRVQQVMSHPVIDSTVKVVSLETSVRTDATPTEPSAPTATAINPAPSEPPPPAVTRQAAVPATPTPEERTTRDLAQDTERANRVRLRQAEVKRAVDLENQRKAVERKKRQQEIETASLAVKRMLQDNRSRQIVQADNSGPVRLGFFGRDN